MKKSVKKARPPSASPPVLRRRLNLREGARSASPDIQTSPLPSARGHLLPISHTHTPMITPVGSTKELRKFYNDTTRKSAAKILVEHTSTRATDDFVEDAGDEDDVRIVDNEELSSFSSSFENSDSETETEELSKLIRDSKFSMKFSDRQPHDCLIRHNSSTVTFIDRTNKCLLKTESTNSI